MVWKFSLPAASRSTHALYLLKGRKQTLFCHISPLLAHCEQLGFGPCGGCRQHSFLFYIVKCRLMIRCGAQLTLYEQRILSLSTVNFTHSHRCGFHLFGFPQTLSAFDVAVHSAPASRSWCARAFRRQEDRLHFITQLKLTR